MTGSPQKKPPWDQRLTEHMARQSREAANDPSRHRQNPSFWAQIKSPYYWFGLLAFAAAVVIYLTAGTGWPRALAAILYVVTFILTWLSRRDALRTQLGSSTADED